MGEATKLKSKTLYCSFCRKNQEQVRKLVGGPGVYICDACVDLCNRWIAGKRVPKTFPGWDSLSDQDLLKTLVPASEAVRATEEILREHVAMLRTRGITWDRIGEALGVSRQAVWGRFSSGES
jgi:hypothetical protein